MVKKRIKAAWSILRFTLRSLLSAPPPDVRGSCSSLLSCLGFDLKVSGKLPDGPCLVVANHLSYLDIPIIATLRPMVFVTSYEVRDQWATGFFSKLGGCIFVERRNYSTLLADIQQIKQALRSGHTVCLFPEGTTSSGSMLPWKSSLLEAAARLGVPVVPLAIKYITVNGRAVFGQDKDLLYYYGDMDFTSHLGRLVREVGSVSVRVDILEPTVGKARKKITESARLSVKRQLYL